MTAEIKEPTRIGDTILGRLGAFQMFLLVDRMPEANRVFMQLIVIGERLKQNSHLTMTEDEWMSIVKEADIRTRQQRG